MFWSGRKQARQVAQHVEQFFSMYFEVYRANYIKGIFRPPERFWFDGLILGFVNTLSGLFRDHLLRRGGDAPEKKAKFLLDVLLEITYDERLGKAVGEHVLNNWRELQGQSDYCLGADVAIVTFTLVYGVYRWESAHPLVEDAMPVAKAMVNTGQEKSLSLALVYVIVEKNMGQHLRENYLKV